MHEREDHLYEAEIYRLKGELLLSKAAGEDGWRKTPHETSMRTKAETVGVGLERVFIREAEACFRQVLAVARRQQAKSLELRAAMSLSRLWQQQDKCTAAYQLLAPVYGWFTEGFDTADLQEAKALLEALA
jgi:hypothetical protein